MYAKSFKFRLHTDGVDLRCRGSWFWKQTIIRAAAPFCHGIKLKIADNAGAKAAGLTPPHLLKELGDLRVSVDPDRLAATWLDADVCRALRAVDEYDRYAFVVLRGLVTAQAYHIEADKQQLNRAIEAVVALARRGRQLHAQWDQLSFALCREHLDASGARWALGSASPIRFHRGLLPLTVDTTMHPVPPCPHVLHTRVRAGALPRSADVDLGKGGFCELALEEAGASFYLPGYVTDLASIERAVDAIAALCVLPQAAPRGAYR